MTTITTTTGAGGASDCSHSSLEHFPPSIRELITAIRAEESFTPNMAKRLLEESSIVPEDLAQWADFDHPAADSYGRKLVFDGGCFELMVMSWVDGDMAAIHDHGYTQWGAVKLFGPAEHAIFKMRDGRLATSERRVFEAGDVVSVAHDLIHQMGNVGAEPFLSLHLYGCYGRDGDITADARLYELDEGAIQRTSGGVFFNLPEGQVNAREPGLEADFPTQLRHKVELLKRMMRANNSLAEGTFQDEAEQALAQELFATETWQQASDDIHRADCQEQHLQSRYCDILYQELTATARLLTELQNHGLIDHPVASGLQDVTNVECTFTVSKAYVDLLSNHSGVDIALPMAA